MKPSEIRDLEEMHADLLRLHAQALRQQYFRLNQAIHSRLSHLTRNPVLEDVYTSLQRRVYRARALSNMERLRWDESAHEHERIMVALRHLDGARLAHELVSHSRATEAVILREVAKALAKSNIKA